MTMTRRRDVSVADILERWSAGEISTALTINEGRFNGFADLLEAALNSNIPIRTKLLEHEKRQAERFVEMMLSP